MLVRILSYYQVMPSYLDFLFVFGIHIHSREARFSSFRGQFLPRGVQNLTANSARESGHQIQLCYNLKAVAKQVEPGCLGPVDPDWTVRQGSFHHQFDTENGTALWIVTRAGQDIKQRIEDMTGIHGRNEDREFQTPEQCLGSSLAVHLLLCHWSCENWRAYFQWLEDTVDNEVSSTYNTVPRVLTLMNQTYLVVYGSRNYDEPRRTYSTFHLQRAQHLEERISEATMVLEGNIDVLSSLKNFYHDLVTNDQFSLHKSCSIEISSFEKQTDSFVYDSKMQVARGQLLAKIIAARKSIVCILELRFLEQD